MKKIKVGAVSYLNTKPLLYGIKQHSVFNEIALSEEYPARIAEMLLNNEIDVGLVPVAVIPKLKEHYIITDYCIGCDGPVASVGIFSEVPIEQVKKVSLDYQSRTSVMLATILLKEFWKSDAELVFAKGEDYRKEIKGTAAGLVIGDRAFEQRLQSKYMYDLGEAWKAYTGLPFVFAAWVANKQLPEAFVDQFNDANGAGLKNLDKVAAENPVEGLDLHDYYQSHVSYRLTEPKKEALRVFLSKLKAMGVATG